MFTTANGKYREAVEYNQRTIALLILCVNLKKFMIAWGTRGSKVVKALSHNPEGCGFET
jgi:hypothetical protein